LTTLCCLRCLPRASYFFFLIRMPPPRSRLFPYTTLFRSEPVVIEDQSITTAGKQMLVIDQKDIDYMDGKRILIVDDVISTGGSLDRKSTRLNSSHVSISYAVFCLKKKKQHTRTDGKAGFWEINTAATLD